MSRRRSGLFHDRKAYGCYKSSVICNITSIENVQWTYFVPTGDYSTYSYGWLVSWNPIPNGTVYLISQTGIFGEHNQVLALHRPLLGNNTMTNINNEHHTSSHHPHISIDKQFYSCKPHVVMSSTYGKYHEVFDENMVSYQKFLSGLKEGRVQPLSLGIHLKTVDGSKEVTYLDTYEMPPETQLYNLVLSGSHTYHVDGYTVTGWPNEDDFDYDTWNIRNN